jgi:hypothetical protein
MNNASEACQQLICLRDGVAPPWLAYVKIDRCAFDMQLDILYIVMTVDLIT